MVSWTVNRNCHLFNFGQSIEKVKALGVWLIDQYNMEVHYSEFLPHGHYPCPKEQNLPDCMFERNTFCLTYNEMVAQARNNRYTNIDNAIFHPQVWDGTKNIRHEYYETEPFRKWWGRLHLNNAEESWCGETSWKSSTEFKMSNSFRLLIEPPQFPKR